MAHNEIVELQQQLDNLNEQLRNRENRIAALEAEIGQDEQRRAVPPVPIQRHEPDINEECQRGKVPDLIKNLPNFSGNAKQLNGWLNSVDRILRIYGHLDGTDLYELWLQEIRNKIVGEAGDLLASNGVPLDWARIKEQLKLIYGDKRELSTLLQKLFSLRQSRSSVVEFYSKISDVYTGISTHIQMDEKWQHPNELIKFVDKMCLEKFVDGLEEPYSSHVGLLQPTTLSQAYQFANEKANKIARRNGECEVNTRSQFKTIQKPLNQNFPQTRPNESQFHQNTRPIPTAQMAGPSRPPNTFPYFRQPFYQNTFKNPNTLPPPHNNAQNSFQNAVVPPRPLEPNAATRSHRINYMNRPQRSLHWHEGHSDDNHHYDQIYDGYYEDAENGDFADTDQVTAKVETSQTTSETVTTDDLNFHIATDFRING